MSGPLPSEQLPSATVRHGLELSLANVAAGAVIGTLASIVLVKGGGGTQGRAVILGLGVGMGLGSAWTKTSKEVENLWKK